MPGPNTNSLSPISGHNVPPAFSDLIKQIYLNNPNAQILNFLNLVVKADEQIRKHHFDIMSPSN